VAVDLVFEMLVATFNVLLTTSGHYIISYCKNLRCLMHIPLTSAFILVSCFHQQVSL